MADPPIPTEETPNLNQFVAANIRRLRIEREFTQAEFATQLERFSDWRWTASKVSDIENAAMPPTGTARSRRERKISVEELAVIANALYVSWFELVLPREDENLQVGGPPRVYGRSDATIGFFWMPPAALDEVVVVRLRERAEEHFAKTEQVVLDLLHGMLRGAASWRDVIDRDQQEDLRRDIWLRHEDLEDWLDGTWRDVEVALARDEESEKEPETKGDDDGQH